MSKAARFSVSLLFIFWVLFFLFTYYEPEGFDWLPFAAIIMPPLVFGFLEGYFANVSWALLIPASLFIAACIWSVYLKHFPKILGMAFVVFNFLYLIFFACGKLLHASPLRTKMKPITSVDVALIIERFLEGKGSGWEWDDFVSTSISDQELDGIRKRCEQLYEEFPPEKQGEYTSEKGRIVLQEYVRQLRTGGRRKNTLPTQ